MAGPDDTRGVYVLLALTLAVALWLLLGSLDRARDAAPTPVTPATAPGVVAVPYQP